MRAAIIGSRSIGSFDFNTPVFEGITSVVTGGASGVDTLAEEHFKALGIEVEVIRPDYKKHPPKIAPIIRNREIVDKADIVIAIWDGESRGTLSALNYANKIGKKQIALIYKEGIHKQTIIKHGTQRDNISTLF